MTAAAQLPREERLLTTAGLRGNPPLALSAWRGRSGRRYVVGIHKLTASSLEEIGQAVLIAVRRDGRGLAQPVGPIVHGDLDAGPAEHRRLAAWAEAARKAGATELHVHRLAETAAERRAVADDLSEGV